MSRLNYPVHITVLFVVIENCSWYFCQSKTSRCKRILVRTILHDVLFIGNEKRVVLCVQFL